MDNNLLSEVTKHYHSITNDDVVGVSFSKKRVDGKITDQPALVFTVLEKKPIDQIPEDQLIPKVIEFSGQTFLTDVQQGFYEFASCPSSFYTWQLTPPTNRNTFRPLQGGISTSNFTSMSGYVGTMGFIAVDNETNSLVGVSNNHVWVQDAFIASQRIYLYPKQNTYLNFVTQPNEFNNFGFQNAIGLVKKYVPLSGSPTYNTVDVALCTVNSSEISNTQSYKQVGMTGWTQPLEFATTSEIDNLLTTNPNCFSSGRTTGPKGEGEMKLLIDSVSAVIGPIGYERQNILTPIQFADCITFVASASTTTPGDICPYPINGGDSGSALVAEIGGVRKIIGLVFASLNTLVNGQPTPVAGIANRIDKVVQEMNISPWTGNTVNFSNTGATQTFTVAGRSPDETVIVGSNTYWQSGLI